MGTYTNIYNSILTPENWNENNMSLFSAYIKYISIFIAKVNSKIIDDKEKFQVVMGKIVQLECYDLFFRFLDEILAISGLKGFYECGFVTFLIQGTEAIVAKSPKNIKLGLTFALKMIYFNNPREAMACVIILYNLDQSN